jgi:hypothetical protein
MILASTLRLVQIIAWQLLLVNLILFNQLLDVMASPRIITQKTAGGTKSEIAKYPFAANIHINKCNSCGGSIISKQ